MKNKFLVLIVLAGMLFTMTPVGVYAEEIALSDATNCTGACTHKAEIGNVHYDSLNDAIDKAKTGDKIKIINNINLSAEDVVPLAYSGNNCTFAKITGKSITIDLNGKDLYGNAEGISSTLYGFFSVQNNGHLVLEDSVGGATVSVRAGDKKVYALLVSVDEISKNEGGSTITVKGGNYSLDKASDCLIGVRGNELITIEGGTYNLGNIATGSNGSPWIFNAKGQNTAHVIVTGGTFNDDINHQHYPFEVEVPKERALVKNGDGTWTMVDAVVSVLEFEKSGDWYCHEVGYYSMADAIEAAKKYAQNNIDAYNATPRHERAVEMKNTDEWEKLIVYNPVVSVNGTKYESFEEALDKALDGDVIKVLIGHEIEKTVIIDKNVIIDFEDKTITAASSADPVFRIQNGAEVTVRTAGGGIDAANGKSKAFVVGSEDGSSAGKLNIENGKYRAATSVVSVAKGQLVINGGEFELVLPDASAGAPDYNYLLDCVDAKYKNGDANIVVKGGKYHNFDPANNKAEGEKTNFVAEGYESKLISAEDSEVWEVSLKEGQKPADDENSSTNDAVDTGDDTNRAVPIGLMAAALTLMIIVYTRRKTA